MTFSTIHLVCNAHLDPVWLWEWQEGAAEAISTFRTAADFCDQFPGFVFNHNEAILYRWIEEYEPALFRRIQSLVRRGRWHIMGGWHLQPDCNLPSGEAFVRQIQLGREYFTKAFGVHPTTAIGLDAFGHSRGLVQILAKSGYDSYLFCRPVQKDCPLPAEEFIWEGYDSSRIMAARGFDHYLTSRGQATAKVQKFIGQHPGADTGLILWGIGNHGGGASREDLLQLTRLMRLTKNARICHSTPEAFFKNLRRRAHLPVFKQSLNPWAVGCYTSQSRIKQTHRQLENELFSTEKMLAAAWLQVGLPYPGHDLREIMRDMATGEFHDILPGSSIQPVETASLRLMHHALEELARLKTRAFIALTQGQPHAPKGLIPICVYNPHPFPVHTQIECEFQLPDMNFTRQFTSATACCRGRPLPTQIEHELSNLPFDWRKRIVFSADLAPAQMNRFDCRLKVMPAKPAPRLKSRRGIIRFKTKNMLLIINTRTGLVDRYRTHGREMIKPGAFKPLVMRDNEDSWGMLVRGFRKRAGAFRLLSSAASARFSGVRASRLPPVRVIEDGPVRAVVEAVFGYGHSFLVQRYFLPKTGTEFSLETRVYWHERDRMLKLAIPTIDRAAICRGQTAYGVESLPSDGQETLAQKWVAVESSHQGVLSCINKGTYGLDFCRGELRISLLRSAAYAGHPFLNRPILPPDRFSARMDQGEHVFMFWINAGPGAERRAAIDREALARNEVPMALSFFPDGIGQPVKPFIALSDKAVQITALKKAQHGNDLILRLFEPTGRARTTLVTLPWAGLRRQIRLDAFEISTWRVNIRRRTWQPVNLMERHSKTIRRLGLKPAG